MANNIDRRVVEMQFDNQQFERGISTSISSLDKMKESLKLDESAKSLNNLERAGKSFSLAGIGDGVAAISNKFTAMEIVAITALQNITNSAINYGKQIVSSLTIDPIKTGFEEYETQIGAIQTILANTSSKGKTLEDVNGALDELNRYADMTIYNFTEMTRNIGTFTAAGVDLDTSVQSIKGIANLAAVSGSTSQQASTAMYQLSQALASGTVKLMDWNSVVNAGMGGQVFQDALKRTAQVMGVTGEEAQAAFAKLQSGELSFRDSLSSGWLTTDVLTATLQQFAGDISEAELLAMGYTQEQAAEILEMAKTATEAATKVKTFTQLMDTLKEAAQSGWTQSWELIVGDFEEAKALLTGFSDYFGAIINASAESRNKVLTEWKELGGRNLLFGDNGVVWNIIHSIENVVKAFKGAFDEFFPPTTGQQLFNITKEIADFTAKIKAFTEDSEKMDKLTRAFRGIAAAIDIVKRAISAVFGAAKRVFKFLFPNSDGVLNLLATMGDWIVSLDEKVKESDFFNKAFEKVGTVLKPLIDLLSKFATAIKEAFFTNTGDKETILDKIKARFEPFQKVINWVGDILKKSRIGQILGDFLTNIADRITKFVAKTDGVDLAVVITGILGGAALFNLIRQITGIGKTVKKGLKGMFDGVIDGIEGLFGGGGTESDFGDIALKIAGSLVIVAEALTMVSKIDPERLTSSAIVMGVMLVAIGGLAMLFGKLKFGKALSIATAGMGILLISAAISKISDSVVKIGSMDPDALVRGLAGLGVVLIEMAAFMALTKKAKMGVFKGVGMILMAVSINLFAKAIGTIGSLDTDTIVKGIAGLGAVLLELAVFMALTKKAKLGVFKGAALILVAVSMNLFAKAIGKMGELDSDTLVKGIAGLGAVLLELAVFMNLTKKAKLGIFKGAALILMAVSLNLFAKAIGTIGSMDTDTIVKGIAGLGAVLLELAIFMNLTKKAKLGVFKGAALILVAVSMKMFADAIGKIGAMDTNTLVKGIAGLGAVLLELGVFLALTKKAKLGVFKGVGLILTAVSINLFADAIGKIGSFDSLTIIKGIIGLGAVLTELAIFLALTKKAKMGVSKGLGLVLMAVSINMFATAIGKIGNFKTGTIVKGVAGLGIVLLELAAFMKVMGKMKATSIGKSLVVLGVMALSMMVFARVLKNLEGVKVDTMLGFSTSFGVALLSLSATMAVFSAIPFTALLLGIAKLALVAAAVVGLMAVFGALEKSYNVSEYVDFFGNLLGSIGQAFGKLIGGFAQGMFSGFSTIGTELGNFMTNAQPFFDGVKSLNASALEGVKNLAGIIVTIGGANVITAISSWISGGNAIDNFAEDIKTLGEGVKAYAETVSGFTEVNATDVASATAAAQGLVDLTNCLPRSGGLAQKLIGAKDLGDFADDIPALGTSLKSYATEIKGFAEIDQDAFTTAATVAKGIVDLAANLPATGGALQSLVGTKDIGAFAEDIPNLGIALKAYGENINGFGEIDKSAFTIAATTAQGISDLANSIPAQGGVWQNLTGTRDLGTFSDDIPALGVALKTYANEVKGFSEIDQTSLSRAATTAQGISDLANSIPAQGGVWQNLTGTKDLGTFSDDIPALGTALKEYASQVSGFSEIDQTSLSNAAVTAKGISDLAHAIPAQGGVWQNLTGTKDLGDFSTDIPTLGSALKAYADEIKGFGEIDQTSFSSAATTAKGIADLAAVIPAQGGVWQNLTGTKDLGDFSTDIPTLGEALKAYAEQIKGFSEIDESAFTSAATTALGISSLAAAIPAQGGVWQNLAGAKDLGTFSEDIPTLGEALKAYAEEIKDFGEIDETSFTNASITASGIAALAAVIPAEGGILSNLTGVRDLADFSADIPTLGTALKAYVDQIRDFGEVDEAAFSTATSTMTGIAALAAVLPPQGGILQNLTGAKDLGTFSDDIPTLGTAIKSYAEEISGFKTVSEADVTSSTNAAKAIAKLAGTLPTTGGWLQAIIGQQDLGTFSENIGTMGTALGTFATNVGGVSIEESENAIKVMELIQGFTTGLDSEGGIFNAIGDFFGGDQDVVGFSEKMKTVGTNLGSFASSIGGVKIDDAEAATKVMGMVQDLIGDLNVEGGLWSDIGAFFGGKKDIVALSDKIATFGTNFSTFASGLSGAAAANSDFSSVEALMEKFKTLASSVNTIYDSYWNYYIEDLSKILPGFGTSLSDFADSIDGVDVANCSTAVTALNTLFNLAATGKTIDESDIDHVSKLLDAYASMSLDGMSIGFTEGEDNVIAAVEAIATLITGETSVFETAGKTLGSSFVTIMVTEIQNGGSSVNSAGAELGNDGKEGVRSTYSNWYSAGSYLGSGLRNGISSMASSIRNAAVSAASGAVRAIQVTWSIHSPSRVGADLGMNFDLGIANGLRDYAHVIDSNAETAGKTAIDSVKSMLSGIGSIADDMDTTPVIRPVMDMADITNGFNTINGMFGQSETIGTGIFSGTMFRSSASSMSFDGSRIVGSISNQDVVSELQSLNERFNTLSEAVSNMSLVLDTGALVGHTSAKMDAQLGTLASRRERGN